MQFSIEYRCNLSIITLRLIDMHELEAMPVYVGAIIDEPAHYIIDYSETTTTCFKTLISEHGLSNDNLLVYEPNNNVRVEWNEAFAIIYIRGRIEGDEIEELLSQVRPLNHKSTKHLKRRLKNLIGDDTQMTIRPHSWPELKFPSPQKKEFLHSTPTHKPNSSPSVMRASETIEQGSALHEELRTRAKSFSFASNADTSKEMIHWQRLKLTNTETQHVPISNNVKMKIYWLIDNEIGSCNRLAFSFILQPISSEDHSSKVELHLCRDDSGLIGEKLHLPLPLAKMFLLVTKDYDFHEFEIMPNERTMSPIIITTRDAAMSLFYHLKKSLSKFAYW